MRARLLALAVAFVLVAAACGNDDDSEPSTAAAPEPTATPTEAPEPTATPTPEPTEAPEPTPTATPTPEPEPTPTPTPEPAAWIELASTGAGPSARSNPAMAVDPAAGVAYVHGGRSGGTALAELWAVDLATGAWTQLQPEGPAPDPRFSHTAVWDEQRGRLVVFSGQGAGSSTFFSDVWAYDPATNTWAQLAAGGVGPADRYGSCAGYDPAGDRFLISHGFTFAGRFDDTWAFSLADNAWTDISPEGTRPIPRCLHSCTFAPATGSLVLFGGQSNEAPLHGDTWVLADGAWTEAANQPAPSPRRFPTTVATASGVELFGGITADGPAGDSWSFDVTNGAWVPSDVAGAPAARHSHGAALDPNTGQVVVFGGEGAEGELGDVWALNPPG